MWKLTAFAACLVATAACVTDELPDDGTVDADPADFDAKADGVSGTSPAVLAMIDGAKHRVLVQIPTLADKTMLTHLRDAAKRGVDVHAYLAVSKPAHPATVLAGEQLEAAGVDLCVVRKTAVPGFQIIGDDTQLAGSTKITTASKVTAAADAFAKASAEDLSGAPPSLGTNGTALMLMPDSGAGPIVALIAGAKASIDLEIYQLQSPAVVASLIAAQQRGVNVRVMLEPKTVGYQNYKMVSAQLTAAGIAVKATPPQFDSSHNVDHAKFMVVDGAELVFGSGNMVRSGLGGNPAGEFDNRDFWIRDRRTGAVAEAKGLFTADWNRTSAPGFESLVVTPDNADAKIVALIDAAKTRLYVYNQSLADDELEQHLIDAKQRGVDVHVLLGNQPGFGGAPPANQPAIDTLSSAGITAGYFTTHYLHGKVVVSDDAVFIGSQNFTSGGLGKNREVGEILTSSTVVDALAQTFAGDETHPQP
jgi:phosphatidylserine/phosphatidylglycerophosphate/cardiolipin synthase-like enzyme